MERPDSEVIHRRLSKLEKELIALERHSGVTLEQFIQDMDLQAVVERRLQVSAQVTIDIANYIIARGRLEIPEEEENLFIVLSKSGIVSQELALRMKGLVRFRNILVHNYLEIDPEIVYHNFKTNLSDFRQFAKEISESVPEP